MNETQNESTEPEQGRDSGGAIEVGRRLREAREKAGTDINELAARLRLTASQLEAIEEGRLDQFGAPIYARGYVSNYARLVGLKPGPLVERLPGEEGAPRLTAATAVPPGQRLAENVARVATYAIGTIVLALPVLWWASEGSLDALLGKPGVPERVEAAGSDEPPAGTVAENAPAEPVTNVPGTRNGGEQPLMASMAMPRNARTADSPSPAQGDGDDSPVAASVEPDGAAEPAGPPEPELVLEVDADSWVEIRDAAGERLEYDLLRAGTTHRFRGTAPYRVLIGNAGAVSVRYNGAPFDMAPHVQGNLARFEVGAEAGEG